MENSRFGSGFAPVALQRVRLRLSRAGAAADLSHLQQIESIRRALKNAGWPVATSQSKKPIPKVSFGPAISVGYESDAEYCDIQMGARLDLSKAKETLAPHLPPGYSVLAIKSIPRFFPSLEESTNVADYEVRSNLLTDSRAQWDNFWAKTTFLVTKKKGGGDVVIDSRPCVLHWSLQQDLLMLRLRFGPGRTLKPERIVQAVCGLSDVQVAVGTPSSELQVKRSALYFEKDNGSLVEP